MMVETILESSQDFGMLNGVLPQWKRELLQRRAARQRPALPPTPPPPPPPPPPLDDGDEELRYGPGHVKRLKSRYLSLAHRDPPRRRPSVLRRATSLEHLLDERPPPAPRPNAYARPVRPVSVATPAATALIPRRDSVKRARSVDALSRLESREELQPPSPPPVAPRPAMVRSARPPRRPTPLLRETERPPLDVVRSTLRKFESAPTRKPAPAARVSAVLRGLEANQPRSSTPEPRGRSPSPVSNDLSAIEDAEGANLSVETKQVSQAALESIARAGSTVRYSFEAPRVASHLPRIGVANPVLLSRVRQSASPRRIGIIRPMPALTLERSISAPASHSEDISVEKATEHSPIFSPPTTAESEAVPSICLEKRDSPPSAVVEPMVRSPPEEPSSPERMQTESPPTPPIAILEVPPEPVVDKTAPAKAEDKRVEPLVNGYAKPEEPSETKVSSRLTDSKIDGIFTRNGLKDGKRHVNGTSEKSVMGEKKVRMSESGEVKSESAPWTRNGSPGAARKARGPPPATTSVVFNFSNRKEVPDYIENDGLILRSSRRSQFKSDEPGIVVLRPEALVRGESESEGEEEADGGPPSPCGVRFINDNVLINGRSSMPTRPNKDRIARLKLQFDDSLTRTFEYPSETSLVDDSLPANTHIASAALARYTPSKTLPDQFELGVTRQLELARPDPDATAIADATTIADTDSDSIADAPWSEARSHHTDLLF